MTIIAIGYILNVCIDIRGNVSCIKKSYLRQSLFASLHYWRLFTFAAPKEPRLFGFTAMDMTDQSFRLALAELEELVNQNGDSLITFDPQLDNEKQLQGISDMISQGIEVLFLNPVDINGILPALRECRKTA